MTRATVELLVSKRLTQTARAPVEQLVPKLEDMHVRPLLEEGGEHQAGSHHHLFEESLNEMSSREPLQEVVTSNREVHGVSVCGVDGVNQRLRLDEGPETGRRAWDGVPRSVDAVRCERILKLVEAKPGPAVAKGEEARRALLWARRGGGRHKRKNHAVIGVIRLVPALWRDEIVRKAVAEKRWAAGSTL